MGGDDALLQNQCAFLSRDDGKMFPQICSAVPVDRWLTITRRPNQVDKDPMVHSTRSVDQLTASVPL